LFAPRRTAQISFITERTRCIKQMGGDPR